MDSKKVDTELKKINLTDQTLLDGHFRGTWSILQSHSEIVQPVKPLKIELVFVSLLYYLSCMNVYVLELIAY